MTGALPRSPEGSYSGEFQPHTQPPTPLPESHQEAMESHELQTHSSQTHAVDLLPLSFRSLIEKYTHDRPVLEDGEMELLFHESQL